MCRYLWEGNIIMEIWYCRLLRKSVKKFRIWLKSKKIEDLSTFQCFQQNWVIKALSLCDTISRCLDSLGDINITRMRHSVTLYEYCLSCFNSVKFMGGFRISVTLNHNNTNFWVDVRCKSTFSFVSCIMSESRVHCDVRRYNFYRSFSSLKHLAQ